MSDRIRQILIVYKQYRFEVAAVLALGLFTIIGELISAWQFSTVHLPSGCDPYTAQNIQFGWGGPQPTIECINASQAWLNINNGLLMRLTASPWTLPFIFGVVLGAPLVAREVESGTAAISWALAGSRRRWLLGRMGAMLLLIVPLLLLAGLSGDLLYGAINQGSNPWASFTDYQGRGLPLLFWGLAAFAGTVAVSSLIGRQVPALLVAAFVCLSVRGQWDALAARTWLQPFAVVMASGDQLKTGDVTVSWSDDLVLKQLNYLHGEPWDGDMNAWFNEHMVNTVNPDGTVYGRLNVPQSEQPTSIPFGIWHDRYWPVVALNAGILLAGALFCAVVGLFWVGRRKPY